MTKATDRVTAGSVRIDELQRRPFPSYPKYRNSGVEWLGEIPAHWNPKPFKASLVCNDSRVWGEDFDDDGTIVLRSTDQTKRGGWRITEPARRRLSAREATYAKLLLGDLLVTKSSGSAHHIGKTSIVDESIATMNCCYSNFMQRLRVSVEHVPRFFWYFMNCTPAREQLVFLSSTTTGLGNLNGSILGAIRVPMAPPEEQRYIAEFLDRETAKIDALVARKERLIELLQEKRIALITRAVTRGLDPNVPMKDSGVEWLGEIPVHWDVKRLHHLLDTRKPLSYGILLPGPRLDDGVPYIGAGDVAPGRLRLETLPRTTREIAAAYPRTRMQAGKLVYAIRGSFGSVEVIDEELAGVNLSRDAARIGPRKTTNPSWLAYALRARSSLVQFEVREIGAAITGVNIRDLKRTLLPVPSNGEQTIIANFLDVETIKIDALVAKICQAIDHLKEFRTALISAAVTGKIYVREEAA